MSSCWLGCVIHLAWTACLCVVGTHDCPQHLDRGSLTLRPCTVGGGSWGLSSQAQMGELLGQRGWVTFLWKEWAWGFWCVIHRGWGVCLGQWGRAGQVMHIWVLTPSSTGRCWEHPSPGHRGDSRVLLLLVGGAPCAPGAGQAPSLCFAAWQVWQT